MAQMTEECISCGASIIPCVKTEVQPRCALMKSGAAVYSSLRLGFAPLDEQFNAKIMCRSTGPIHPAWLSIQLSYHNPNKVNWIGNKLSRRPGIVHGVVIRANPSEAKVIPLSPDTCLLRIHVISPCHTRGLIQSSSKIKSWSSGAESARLLTGR